MKTAAWLAALISLTAWTPVSAQEQAATGNDVAPAIRSRHSLADVAVSIGEIASNFDNVTGVPELSSYAYNSPGFRRHTAYVVTGGYYWTEHLNSDLEVVWTGMKQMSIGGQVDCNPCRAAGSPNHQVFLSHHFQIVRLSAAQVYQFGRRTRFRPYLGAGVGTDRERDRRARTEETDWVWSPPVAGTDTMTVVDAFAKAGVKMYRSAAVSSVAPFFFIEAKGGTVGRTVKVGFGMAFSRP